MRNLFLLFALVCSIRASAIPGVILGSRHVCVGSVVTFSDTTAPSGGTWSSGDVTIATIGSSTGTLTGVSPGLVLISYTIGATIDTTTVEVHAIPALSSSLTPPSICDSNLFSYTPTSSVTGTAFSWSRAVVPRILNPAATGMGDPGETLVNATATAISVPYVYTLSAYSCVGTQTVTVTVNPEPVLSSSLTPPAICDSTIFSYTPASLVTGTTFAWSRAAVAGISNPAATGVGNPSEILNSTLTSPISVTYTYFTSASGCVDTASVTVIVNPCPLAISEYIVNSAGLHVYPNPAGSSFTLEMGEWPDNAVITIADVTGRVVAKRTKANNSVAKEVFDSEELAKGLYIIKVNAGQQVYTQRVFLQ